MNSTLSAQIPGTKAAPVLEAPYATMLAGLHHYADALTVRLAAARRLDWQQHLQQADAAAFVAARRRRLREIIGAADPRCAPVLSVITDTVAGDILARAAGVTMRAVRWRVFEGLEAEGLLLEPGAAPRAGIVLLPDCDQQPEELCGLCPESGTAPVALALARAGCRVLVPVLLGREDTHSVLPGVRLTNQPHRELIYRAAFELGRHVIGMEAQVVSAALDWLDPAGSASLAVMGYGEGGLVALCAAAVDERLATCVVSGSFGPRENLWQEPIYRNVFSLLRDFGEAEIAALIAPRTLILEASRQAAVCGPPPPREGRSGAAPGRLETPAFDAVHREWEAACHLWSLAWPQELPPVLVGDGACPPWSRACLEAVAAALGLGRLSLSRGALRPCWTVDAARRQERLFRGMLEVTQRWLREAEFRRAALWARTEPPTAATWDGVRDEYRRLFWEEVIGKLPAADRAPNACTRLLYQTERWAAYEVYLDVWQEVFAFGILLLPLDLRADERRPVVVCQHGLEGTPRDVIEATESESAYRCYAARLADRGFVVYAPQNPYKGGDLFRALQRRLNPLGLSLFSVIVRQHEVTLAWLASLPGVDPARIAFYGISYGGKTAMRVPALLDGYCLSICSADYNEWIWKNASALHPYSYLFTGEYEIFEFNLGNTFNYAEMARLIYPRPFMVERGHHDGVAPDEWVAYEYAKAFRFYDLMGRRDRIEMEVFDGPHAIHGQGTFDFLHRQLNWAKPAAPG
jgi:dienelactone hydrolase